MSDYPQQKSTGLSVAAMSTGIAGLVLSFLPCCGINILGALVCLTGIILGIVALNQIKAGTAGGSGQAKAGLICGIIGVVVVIGTYIQQIYEKKRPTTRAGIRAVVIEAGSRRIRPTLMSTATTIIALLPVLWSTGRGSDVLQPMALPVIGGMFMDILTLFVVPTAMCFWLELTRVKRTTAVKRTD